MVLCPGLHYEQWKEEQPWSFGGHPCQSSLSNSLRTTRQSLERRNTAAILMEENLTWAVSVWKVSLPCQRHSQSPKRKDRICHLIKSIKNPNVMEIFKGSIRQGNCNHTSSVVMLNIPVATVWGSVLSLKHCLFPLSIWNKRQHCSETYVTL